MICAAQDEVVRPKSESLGSVSFVQIVRDEIRKGTRGGALLDIGCGSGALTMSYLGDGFSTVVGVDADPSAVAEAQASFAGFRGIEFRVGDAERLSLVLHRDELFDCVVTTFALHHMHVNGVLDAVIGHLRPGGRVVVVDIFADQRESLASYLLDQFVGSFVRHPSSFVGSVAKLGCGNTMRYLGWRLKYSLSNAGRLHIKSDLSRGTLMSFDEWRAALRRHMPGGSLFVIVASTFVFSWGKD